MEIGPISNQKNPPENSLLDCLNTIRSKWDESEIENACTICQDHLSKKWKIHFANSGEAEAVTIDLKEILKLISNDLCDRIVICHYHPIGSTNPSETDLPTTRLVAQICRAAGVQLYDHIILGTGQSFSFRTAGYL